jgi:hypothetical protein
VEESIGLLDECIGHSIKEVDGQQGDPLRLRFVRNLEDSTDRHLSPDRTPIIDLFLNGDQAIRDGENFPPLDLVPFRDRQFRFVVLRAHDRLFAAAPAAVDTPPAEGSSSSLSGIRSLLELVLCVSRCMLQTAQSVVC